MEPTTIWVILGIVVIVLIIWYLISSRQAPTPPQGPGKGPAGPTEGPKPPSGTPPKSPSEGPPE